MSCFGTLGWSWSHGCCVLFNDTLRFHLRRILFAVLGTFGGTILGVAVGILNLTLNSDCTSGGVEGACAMGIPLIAICFVVLDGGISAWTAIHTGVGLSSS